MNTKRKVSVSVAVLPDLLEFIDERATKGGKSRSEQVNTMLELAKTVIVSSEKKSQS